MNDTNRVLITGAGGFIGSRLSARCRLLGWKVRATFRNKRGLDQEIDWVQADLADPKLDWNGLLDGIDVVYHLAWSTVPSSAAEDPARNIFENIPPGVRLAAAVAKTGSARLVFLSSGGTVYGTPLSPTLAETHPTAPVSFYGEGKLMMERHLALIGKLHNLDVVILRVSNPFGPSQQSRRDFGAIATFAARALNDEEIIIWGDGSVVRDYLFIEDVIDATIMASSTPTFHKVFNIGSGEGRTLNEIVATLEILIGREIRVRYEPSRPYDVPVNVLDITRAREELGWTPRTSFLEGLNQTVRALAPV